MRSPRSLDDIESDLSSVLRSNTANVLALGRLLNEAKALMDHGKWLPWLRRHRVAERSARNYMAAAEWADQWDDKTATVADLENLSPGRSIC